MPISQEVACLMYTCEVLPNSLSVVLIFSYHNGIGEYSEGFHDVVLIR